MEDLKIVKIFVLAGVVLVLLVAIISVMHAEVRAIQSIATARETYQEASAELAAGQALLSSLEGEAQDEDAQIDAALIGQGYFSDLVPLTYDLQDVLQTACARHDIAYPIALGLIEQESAFNPLRVSSKGCYGLMQLSPEYFPVDLPMDEQIIAGIDYLGYQLRRYGGDVETALTAYHAGHDDCRRGYARAVLSLAERWEAIL